MVKLGVRPAKGIRYYHTGYDAINVDHDFNNLQDFLKKIKVDVAKLKELIDANPIGERPLWSGNADNHDEIMKYSIV